MEDPEGHLGEGLEEAWEQVPVREYNRDDVFMACRRVDALEVLMDSGVPSTDFDEHPPNAVHVEAAPTLGEIDEDLSKTPVWFGRGCWL